MSTEACILSWLIRKPAHGYELQQVLRRYSDVHPMNRVNVYPLMRALEEKKWVSSRTELQASRARKVYAITAQGKAEFDHWLNSAIEDPRPKVSDPVMLRVLLTTDLDRDFDWLREAISDTRERRDHAATTYARRKCHIPRIVQIAVEEQIANLSRRLDFLLRVETAIGEDRASGLDHSIAR